MPSEQTRIVELHGFSPSEKSPFLSVFTLSRCRPIAYKEKGGSDIAELHLVNADNPSAMDSVHPAEDSTRPVILIGNAQPPNSSWRWMTKPIRWVRLIELLDEFATLRLPTKHRGAVTSPMPLDPLRASAPAPAPMSRVLVVDDNLTVRQFMSRKLNPFRCEVDFAESGEQALELARTHHYNCIFLDVVMDGIDGYQTCKILRQNSRRKTTSIIMLTSRGSSIDKIRGKMAGCNGYLTKPVDEQKLLETFAQLLSVDDTETPVSKVLRTG